MIIDWFTVSAQLINFLVLVYLLKRFLYQPIIKAIDARETQLAATLADAEARHIEAIAERDKFQQHTELFAQQRQALFIKASTEAEIERQRLLDTARLESETLLIKRQQALMQEHHILGETIIQRIQQEVFALSGKVLSELANSSLEQQIISVFLQRLSELNAEQKEHVIIAITTSKDAIIIRSAFVLSVRQQQQLIQTLSDLLAIPITVQFINTEHLISGLELSVNGQKLAWSISDYLTHLETTVTELFIS